MAKRTAAQLEKDIAEYMANPKIGDKKWEHEWADLLSEKHAKARMPTVDELARALRYIESEFVIKGGRVSAEHWAEGLAFGRYAGDDDHKFQAEHMLEQLSAGKWLRIAEQANYLAREQGEAARYVK